MPAPAVDGLIQDIFWTICLRSAYEICAPYRQTRHETSSNKQKERSSLFLLRGQPLRAAGLKAC